ncbi:hypothetical protein C9374_006834 [Naegleria lovaniensis]|uniref:Guanylate cyclase domain-containing protein n=1 Tax=Naegleria lovaniensis TaxID=51637 RepID=A0AA88GYC8_NAELO|nr:uncharacterized protein C9374_006834 [Naegleria lovaniensis]KAG2393303.1 hypothetical protein C9374_006834 [Naegleria lovaniensis]
MTRIIPSNDDNPQRASTDDQEETSSLFDADTKSQGEAKAQRRNPCLGFLLSIRLFLVLLIMGLVLVTAISIWIASYLMNQHAAVQSTKVLIDNINQKVSIFLDGYLNVAKSVAFTLSDDYHRFVVNTDHSIFTYHYNRLVQTSVTLMNLCFGENGMNGIYALDAKSYAVQNFNESKVVIVAVNFTGASFTNKVLINIPYVVNKTDYYMESVRIFSVYPNGGFGQPYKVLSGGAQSMFYSAPVYDRSLFPSKKVRVGISKINISLGAISQFLSNLKILNRGYIILTEYENDMVIGSNLVIPGVGVDRIPVRNVTTRRAGELMSSFLSLNASEDTIITMQGKDGINYMISASSYRIDNLRWKMIFVFEQDEILESVILSSYSVLGVTIGVTVIGLFMSILIGWAITNPLQVLQNDFRKIEVMQLADIKPHSSIFTETKNIYLSITDTVNWLREFRAFLPENILNQLETHHASNESTENSNSRKSETPESKPLQATNNNEATSKNDGHNHSSVPMSESKQNLSASSFSSRQSESTRRSDRAVARDLFKIGLSNKECCIMYIKVCNVTDRLYDNPHDLSGLISKYYASLAQICKTMKVDIHPRSYDEFVIVFNDNVYTLEAALRIRSLFSSLNESLKKEGKAREQLGLNIGISYGSCLQGNIGNKQTRYYCMTGYSMKCSRELCYLNHACGTTILVDEKTFSKNKANQNFIFRPAERYYSLGDMESSPQFVYELMRKNVVHDDEWLYELESKKANEKITRLCALYPYLFSSDATSEKLSELVECVRSLKESATQGDDKLLRQLEELATKRANQNEDLTHYKTCIGISATQDCDELDGKIFTL